jgi:hypothetical protein
MLFPQSKVVGGPFTLLHQDKCAHAKRKVG